MNKLVVGNWKMNQNLSEISDFYHKLNSKNQLKHKAWIAPQALHLNICAQLGNLPLGLQNCSDKGFGAYTGENSLLSAKEMGASFIILGHSERRQYFQETNKSINKKINFALRAGLKVIYCIGETLKENEDGQTLSVLKQQLSEGLNDLGGVATSHLIVAYEPVWAIGTGKSATPSDAQNAHLEIRNWLKNRFHGGEKIKLLYGGSVKPENVKEYFSCTDIDGALVGGASLKGESFIHLCQA